MVLDSYQIFKLSNTQTSQFADFFAKIELRWNTRVYQTEKKTILYEKNNQSKSTTKKT